MKKKLIDLLIKELGIPPKEATGLILSGKVLINDTPITKVNTLIDENILKDNNLRIKKSKRFVSRGGEKLKGAIDDFNIKIEGKTCIDIGSSTGGFTEVLLQNNAKKVYCIDSGKNQLDYTLRINNKITVFENTLIQNLDLSNFNDKIDLGVMDVSFTSSVFIITNIFDIKLISELIVLIKPQFEYERLRDILNLTDDFNGIVKNSIDRDKIIEYIHKEISDSGLNICNIAESKIKGAKGNVEYFFLIKN